MALMFIMNGSPAEKVIPLILTSLVKDCNPVAGAGGSILSVSEKQYYKY